ncbi:hypothetical protein K438DRAFT_1778245 [Mycena galopus ATCC 62051]|nr:hypothetical protein K438DRAFT_1778245 [Mycena galopus ATCC 62051]
MGRKSHLPADQTAYLESVYPEWLEKRPHLTSFWGKVERGWFAKWPVEPGLNIPIATASIESELSEEDQLRIGDAEEAMKKVIHNWINYRGQKEKKAIAANNPATATSVPLRELFVALGRKGTRIKQRTEVWTARNLQSLRDALDGEDYTSMMGVSDDEENPEQRRERIKEGKRRQMALKRAVTQRLYDESPEEEKAAVEEIYLAQKSKTKKNKGKKAETPEEFQMGLDQLGPVLKEFHAAVTDMTGWVGGTVLVGPVPKEGGKIGTQSYCHGATAAGHTLDQAHPRWGEQVVNPLQQFGKKVFDHKIRRERVLQSPETFEGFEEAAGGGPDGGMAVETVRRRRKSTTSRKKKTTPRSGDVDATASADSVPRLRLNTDNLISFNTQSTSSGDMNDDFDTTSPLETPSSPLETVDMTMIDPSLRGNSPAAGEDPFDAGNDEPRPEQSLATPIFEIRSMSADSPSHQSLVPFTEGFQFDIGVGRTTPTGSTTPLGSPTVGGRVPGHPFGLFRLAGSGTANGLSPPPTRGAAAPVRAPPTVPSPPAAQGAPGAPATPPARGAPAAPAPSPPTVPSPPAAQGASGALATPPARGAPAAPAPSPPTVPSPPAAQGAPGVPATPPARGAPVAPAPSSPTVPSPPAAQGAPQAPATPPARVAPAAPAPSPPTVPSPPVAPRGALPPPARGGALVDTPTRPRPRPLVRGSGSFPSATSTPSPLRFVHTSETPETPVSSLTHDDFPQSRPMANTPPVPKPPGTTGRGGHTGPGTRGHGRGRGGQRGRGGTTGRGVRDEDDEGLDQGMGDGTSAHNNTVVPVSHERMKEIRAFEKKRDAVAAQAAKDRDHGIYSLGPPPAGQQVLPQGPGPAALGARRIEAPIKLASRAAPPPPRAPSGRERRPPVRVPVNVMDLGKENTTEGGGGKGKNKTGDGGKGKRKVQAENEDVEVGGRSKKK